MVSVAAAAAAVVPEEADVFSLEPLKLLKLLMLDTLFTLDVEDVAGSLVVTSGLIARTFWGSQSEVPSSVGVGGKDVAATEKLPEFVGQNGAVLVAVYALMGVEDGTT